VRPSPTALIDSELAPSATELIDRAWTKLAPASKRDFFRKLGLDAADAAQRLRRVSDGKPLHYDEALAMLKVLGLLRKPSPIEVAEEIVTRLDAGETVPKRERETIAKALDQMSQSLPRLAERLRQGVPDARRVP